MQITPTHPYTHRLTQDLFDALWLEDLYGFRTHCSFHLADSGETVLEIALDPARSLSLQGHRASGLRPFRVLNRPAVLHNAARTTNLNIAETVGAIQTAEWWIDRTGRFARFFGLAYDQTAFSSLHEENIMARLNRAPDDLMSWEALSCLKDRPFHPLARAKDWGDFDGSAYSAEITASFPIHWVSLPRDRVRGGARLTGQPFSKALLDPAQQNQLSEAAKIRGADGETSLWLPVHPWQWAWFNRNSSMELTTCTDLGSGPGLLTPTASLRSLAVIGCSGTHLKLSLSINTLGAVRTLPPRYLHNGILAGICLEDLRQKDAWLKSHLLLCNENLWGALCQGDKLEADPGELACLIRHYPDLPGRNLIPMAALPVTINNGNLPAFDYLLGEDALEEDAWILFSDMARALLELGLRCYSQGVMPELHGQNVLLAFKGKRIDALVLRDHDTLRICRSLMKAQGVAAPDYVIDRSTPNTLELDTPGDLLAYLQTLAIGVNLYAILAALSERYGREEEHGWHTVRSALEACLTCVSLSDELDTMTKYLLLDKPDWPFKQILTPLLNRSSFGTGMPSAMGHLTNPLIRTES